MRKCVLLIVMSILCVAICYSQELPDSLKQRNGTYFESRNRYNDSSYVRIQYLNDTILAFHFNSSPFADGEWMGIGRLISYNGKKKWLCAIDYDRDSYHWTDAEYLDTLHTLPIEQVLYSKSDDKEHTISLYNRYVIIQFNFGLNDSLRIEKLRNLSGGMNFDLWAYHKIDNKAIPLDIDKWHNWNKYTKSYKDYHSSTIKRSCGLKDFPILEKVNADKNTWRLQKGDSVVICNKPGGFMKYVFVIKYGLNFKIEKYGWVLRSNLTPLKRVEVPSGVPPIIIKTKIVNGVRVSERVDKPKQ